MHMNLTFGLLGLMLLQPAGAQSPKPPSSLRLYVIDCGRLKVDDPSRFDFKKEELAMLDLSAGCYLIVHPRGTLIWDTGVVPDSMFPAAGGDGIKFYGTAKVPLAKQLAQVGYAPSAIQYLALSHYHWDHVANASQFAKSTWLVSKPEYETMFSIGLPQRTEAALFSPLRNTKTVFLPDSDYDVFGDGSVVIKPTPGHTPGHRVLFLKLAKTGPLVLSGDLYHYPEELKVDRVMVNDFNPDQTHASRAALQVFLKKSGAQLWIQHDLAGFSKLKKLPEYYE
jgi:glyoxylase-like metal-dependent hydrolase (beta-lactamase superfamily II)